MTTKRRWWNSSVEVPLELRKERRGAEKGATKSGQGITLFIVGRREADAEASWPTSMPWFEGVNYQSQEGRESNCSKLMCGQVKKEKG
jgi:hypothetical protein